MAIALDRRDFLFYSAAVAAGVTLGESGRRLLARADERASVTRAPAEETFAVSVCRECAASCGIRVRLVGGTPVKLEGNPSCPLSRGRLCAKGQASLESYFDPDRLVGPARRRTRGDRSAWQSVPWDEAYAAFADRLGRARTAHGTILAISAAHRGPVDAAWTAFWAAIGGRAASVAPRTADRLAPRLAALTGSTGTPIFDLEHATHVLSFGAPIVEDWLSPVWSQRSYGRFRRTDARARGRLVHIDERRSMTARKADEWLPLPVRAHAQLAYGLASVLLRENRVDRARLAAASTNFAGFEDDVVTRFTPDNVAAASGVPVVTLLRLARDLTATPQPLVVVNADADDDLVDAVFALNVLIGAIDRRGGLLQAAVTAEPRVEANADAAIAAFAEHATANDILVFRDASVFRTLRATRDLDRATERCGLVVSLSPYLDEAAAAADLVLPTHTSLESWHGVVPPSPDGVELFACARPAVAPRLDTRDVLAILHATASRLGGDGEALCPFAASDAAIGAELARRWNVRRGGAFANGFETDWMLQLERGGWWVPAAATEQAFAAGVLDAGGWIDPFFSPGDLSDAIRAHGGVTFLPPAAIGDEDVIDAASGREYPLRLVPFTPPEVNVAGGPNQPVLFELLGQPDGAPWNVWAELNPETARALGIVNGAKVRIASAVGSIEAAAMLVERTPPDVVAVAFVPALRGGGRWAKLVSADVRRLFNGADHAAVRVRVTPHEGADGRSGKTAAKEA